MQINDPLVSNPTVESTVITDDPIEILSDTLVFGVIANFPKTKLLSSYPENSSILYKTLPFLVIISTFDTGPYALSSPLLISSPTRLYGFASGVINSAIKTSLRIYSLSDGFSKKSSVFKIFGLTL